MLASEGYLSPVHTEDVQKHQNKQSALRNMDLIMYVLYSDDEVFVMDMVSRVAVEIAEQYNFEDIKQVIQHRDKPMLYRCLFFLLLNFHKQFRYWVLSDTSLGLKPICPYKATRFLIALKNDIVPTFLMDERLRLEEMERTLKTTYIAS